MLRFSVASWNTNSLCEAGKVWLLLLRPCNSNCQIIVLRNTGHCHKNRESVVVVNGYLCCQEKTIGLLWFLTGVTDFYWLQCVSVSDKSSVTGMCWKSQCRDPAIIHSDCNNKVPLVVHENGLVELQTPKEMEKTAYLCKVLSPVLEDWGS